MDDDTPLIVLMILGMLLLLGGNDKPKICTPQQTKVCVVQNNKMTCETTPILRDKKPNG